MHSHRPAATAGFTIIEVMFVLAIAGIITMIVLQAIPQLQRNSRNNQRKQDVAAILQAASHYELNNSGNFPTCAPGDCQNGGTPPGFLAASAHRVQFYDLNNIVSKTPPARSAAVNTIDHIGGVSDPHESVELDNYRKCTTDTSGDSLATNAGAGYLDAVALYYLEQGDGNYTFACQQL